MLAARKISDDFANILAEKMALSRAIGTLELELSHAKSQSASQQNLFAERLSLQHQLDTARVELEMEKRAMMRLLSKTQERQLHDEQLKGQLEELQSDLTKARLERQRALRETQDVTCSLETQQANHEVRQNMLKTKLRSAQDQLKALQKMQRVNDPMKEPSGGADAPGRKNRKRAAQAEDFEAGIGTPGDLPVATKSGIRPSTVGDKSSFSITPYLSRTSKSAADLTPGSPVENLGPMPAKLTPRNGQQPADATDYLENTAEPTFESINNAEAVSEKSSMAVHTARSAGHTAAGSSRIAALGEDRSGDGAAIPTDGVRSILQHPESRFQPGPPARKKKKMLGSQRVETLFDTEDLEGFRRQGSDVLHGSHPRQLGHVGLETKSMRPGRILQAVSTDAFSPLKRDRKLVRP